jgi:hypothetical protein
MDVHVPLAVTLQLRQRAVDVVTAIEDGQTETADFHLLARSTELSRVLVTQDSFAGPPRCNSHSTGWMPSPGNGASLRPRQSAVLRILVLHNGFSFLPPNFSL